MQNTPFSPVTCIAMLLKLSDGTRSFSTQLDFVRAYEALTLPGEAVLANIYHISILSIRFVLPVFLMGDLTVAYFYSKVTVRCAMASWPQLSWPEMSYLTIFLCLHLLIVRPHWNIWQLIGLRRVFFFGCWCHLCLFSFLIGFVFIISVYWFQNNNDMTAS